VKPYKLSEWNRLYEKLNLSKIEPYEILKFSDLDFREKLDFSESDIERIKRLINRSERLLLEIKKYSSMGINIVTKADDDYPKMLKNKIEKYSSPLFYYVGDLELANRKLIGFVGSRSISDKDCKFTERMVKVINEKGYGVVSGGAKGVDTIARDTSISNGNVCVEYISDSLIKKIKNKETIKAVLDNKLLIMSASKPDAGFNIGMAMTRNKYIYAQSNGTIVVKSDFKKGGTWNGATEAIKNKYCPVYCWDNKIYEGNMELLKLGALSIK
ncbi:MAG: DNA-processing protein DprA, partial [Lachnospirales bacterium]